MYVLSILGEYGRLYFYKNANDHRNIDTGEDLKFYTDLAVTNDKEKATRFETINEVRNLILSILESEIVEDYQHSLRYALEEFGYEIVKL